MSPTPSGNISFDDLARMLGEYQELGFARWFLRVRTVAVRAHIGWENYGTSATLLEEYPEGLKRISLRGDVSLIESCYQVREALNSESLSAQLAMWGTALGAERQCEFQESLSLHRSYSDPRTDSWSAWTAQPYEKGASNRAYGVPDGPFLNVEHQVFGQDVPRLAAQYLGSEHWMSQLTTSNRYELTIPDRRARIGKLALEDQQLRVHVERRTGHEIYLCIAGSLVSGEDFSIVEKVHGDSCVAEIPFVPQRFNLWLTLNDGYALDHYYELPERASWGSTRTLFKADSQMGSLPIAEALASGENELLEFKAFIRVKPRDLKTDELLVTASAFANTRGGDVYVGVNDYGEPLGINRELAGEYGKECRESVQCRKQSYERDLTKLIREGLAPNPKPQFVWHDVAHRLVVQIRIPKSPTLVSLLTSGDVFRRVGATNRKIRPADLLSNS